MADYMPITSIANQFGSQRAQNQAGSPNMGGTGNPNGAYNQNWGGYPGQPTFSGQQYGYGRYIPPMMQGGNPNMWMGYGSPYSYNLPNAFGPFPGANYFGQSFYPDFGMGGGGGGFDFGGLMQQLFQRYMQQQGGGGSQPSQANKPGPQYRPFSPVRDIPNNSGASGIPNFIQNPGGGTSTPVTEEPPSNAPVPIGKSFMPSNMAQPTPTPYTGKDIAMHMPRGPGGHTPPAPRPPMPAPVNDLKPKPLPGIRPGAR